MVGLPNDYLTLINKAKLEKFNTRFHIEAFSQRCFTPGVFVPPILWLLAHIVIGQVRQIQVNICTDSILQAVGKGSNTSTNSCLSE